MDRCKIPLLRRDNRTSTEVGLPHRHATYDHYEHVRRPVPEKLREIPGIRTAIYSSTTGRDYGKKLFIQDIGPYGRAKPAQSMLFQRILDEKMRASNLMPLPVGKSEYKKKFVQEKPLTFHGTVYPPNPFALCLSQGMGRDEQRPVSLTAGSVGKLLDPYLSTSQMEHRPFTMRELTNNVNAQNIVTVHDSLGDGPDISVRKEPIYDTADFKNMISLRILPKVVRAVPNKGMKSEMKAKFRYPQDNMSLHQWDSGVEYPDPLPKATTWEVRSIPNMYSTEYFHIGTGWPVRASVDPGWPSYATVDPGVRA